MKSDEVPRTYTSPLRAAQAEQTRDRIRDAIVVELAERPAAFRMADVAARAGVSERTVYRYFPDREAVMGALAEDQDRRFQGLRQPRDAHELAHFAEQMFPAFDANEVLMRARLNTEPGRELRTRQRRARIAQFEGLLDEAGAHLHPAARRRVVGIFGALISSHTWRMFKDEFDLEGPDAARAVGWVLEGVLRALADGDDAGGP